MKKNLIFDLDGTLVDSANGIVSAIAKTLSFYGMNYSKAELMKFIGPPIPVTFSKFGFEGDEKMEAVKRYRSEYGRSGLYESSPYEGIIELLSFLKSEGHSLFVATSKMEKQAREMLSFLKMDEFFTYIGGAKPDESRADKKEVIEYVLDESNVSPSSWKDAAMIGDRYTDMVGAVSLGIKTVGVLYGYGNEKELREAGAQKIAGSVASLKEILSGI